MTGPLRVLLVEDSPSDAKLVLRSMQRIGRPIELERVETAEGMGAALDSKVWDAIISDWSLPHFTALGALSLVKARQLDLPFIIVSGTVGEDTAVEAMRAGAHDYVLKDRLARLAPALERELRDCAERRARHLAEAALRASDARFRRLSESGIIGITIADLHGGLLDANDAYLSMVGYSREELSRGQLRWSEMTPPEFKPRAAAAVEQLKLSGVAPPWETESFRKDGSRVPLLVGVAMLEYPTSIAFVLDLSERRRAEVERARLTASASNEHAARERAEDALLQSESQLRQAQKMEAVGRLAGGVAHDFNNVLSVILSYSEFILLDLKAADPVRADVKEIQIAAKRAAALTRQLLMFSRQQVVEPKVIDLHEVLQAMHSMLARILGEDIDFVLVPRKGTGRVEVDPSHVEQVIINLVVNARDAMPTGGMLTIEVDSVVLDDHYVLSHLHAKAGPYVMMAVTDTGCGMSTETKNRIFEPFFTTKAQGKGTGLGLSTVFGIVQQSGGNIWVYSELGTGTSFKVYLPRVDSELDVLTPQVAPTTLRGTETILLVEDEEQVRIIAVSILRKHGYRVLAAQNAGEALLLCEQHPEPIDAMVTDVVMPQMSGPALAKRLALTRPTMKVLCMSGYADDSIVRHGVLAADMAFIQKPITPASLTFKLRELLDGAPRAPRAETPQ